MFHTAHEMSGREVRGLHWEIMMFLTASRANATMPSRVEVNDDLCWHFWQRNCFEEGVVLASFFPRSAVHDCGGSALWAVWPCSHGFGELEG